MRERALAFGVAAREREHCEKCSEWQVVRSCIASLSRASIGSIVSLSVA